MNKSKRLVTALCLCVAILSIGFSALAEAEKSYCDHYDWIVLDSQYDVVGYSVQGRCPIAGHDHEGWRLRYACWELRSCMTCGAQWEESWTELMGPIICPYGKFHFAQP